MAYKHKQVDLAAIKATLSAPNFLLKIIPHVDGSARICELVEYYLEDITIKGAWTGPGALSLSQHAMAPIAELPVLEVLSTVHILSDLTLGLARSSTTISHRMLRSRAAVGRKSLRPRGKVARRRLAWQTVIDAERRSHAAGTRSALHAPGRRVRSCVG